MNKVSIIESLVDQLKNELKEMQCQFFTYQEYEDCQDEVYDCPQVTFYDDYYYSCYIVQEINYSTLKLVPIGEDDSRDSCTLEELTMGELVNLYDYAYTFNAFNS